MPSSPQEIPPGTATIEWLRQCHARLATASELYGRLKDSLIGTRQYWRIAQVSRSFQWGCTEDGRDVFPYINSAGIPVKAAITGKDEIILDASDRECFFGEHLLAGKPKERPLVLAPDEQTVVVCSILDPTRDYVCREGANVGNLADKEWASGRNISRAQCSLTLYLRPFVAMQRSPEHQIVRSMIKTADGTVNREFWSLFSTCQLYITHE